MRRLLGKTLQQLPAQIGGSLAYFVAMLVWTHYLTPADLGAFVIVTAIQEFVVLVGLSWWSITALRYLTSQEGDEARRRFDQTDAAVMLWGGLAQAVVVVVAVLIALEGTQTPAFIAAAVAFSLTRNIAGHMAQRARARLDSLNVTILQLVGPIGGLALGLIAMRHTPPSVDVVLWSYTAAQTLAVLIGAARLDYASLAPRPDRALIARALAYGGPSAIGSMFSWVSQNAVRFIVGWVVGAAAVGLVSVGWWLGHRLASFAGLAVVSASFSVAVEKIREVGARAALPQVAQNGALLLGVLLPTLFGGLAVADRFVDLYVAADFVELTLVVLPLALLSGIIHEFRNHFSDQAFLLFERPTAELWVSGGEAVVTVILTAVGLHYGGLVGAVVGALAANMIFAVVSMVVAHRMFGIYLDGRDVSRTLLAAVLMGLVIALTPLPGGTAGLIGAVGLGMLSYGAIIALLYRAELTLLLARRSDARPA